MPRRATPAGLVRTSTRAAWRAWLKRNHARKKEAWLVYAKAHTGKPRVAYADAVEEALCFGWIDSTARRLDEDHFMQRFTPRKNTRNWSAPNLERFERLVAQGRMSAAGLAKRPPDVKAPARRFESGEPVPSFLSRALSRHPRALSNFRALAPSYRRNYVRWIIEAKRAETREKRLREAIRRLEKNRVRVEDPATERPAPATSR
ncbi:MAG: YdeI/OmpD-associated family protein [Thermoanaerobaculia bacterium]|nr:YdeI/OmpD-associated family protein [Thermoanaerobaculia bacterium]